MEILRKAIQLAGGVTRLAAALDCRQSVVSNWLMRGQVPAERCRAIEQATGGAVTAEELRPDIFGPTPKRSKEAAA